MSEHNGRLPAHPMPIAVNGAGDVVSTGENLHPDWQGLTKREAFAMAALTVLASGHPQAPTVPADVAAYTVKIADALLAELAKEPT